MVYSIFTPHLLYWLKHVDASGNYRAGLLSLLVQTWLFISVSTLALGAEGCSLNPIDFNLLSIDFNLLSIDFSLL